MIPQTLQSILVDRIKRRAFAQLHRTTAGETALLEIYLAAENLPGSDAVFQELERLAPEWLAPQLARQGADEMRHAEWLEERLVALRGARAPRSRRREELALAALKVERLKRLVDRWGDRFEAGRLVPLLAIVHALEETAVRVMRRHLEVLEREARRGRGAPRTAAVLAKILADEKRHVTECERAIARLVRPAEKLALARLKDEAAAIDRSFGVTSAVGMFAMGVALRGVALVRGAASKLEAAL